MTSDNDCYRYPCKEKGVCPAAFRGHVPKTAFCAGTLRRTVSVSYTHLDVYKRQSNYRVNSIGYMISSTCADMDAAARVIDYVYGEEGNMRANFGEEGVTYEMKDVYKRQMYW